MNLEYVNRCGDRYFVLQGRTKSGKPRYYCARRASATGAPIDRLPEGYEIHERPEDAMVVVRKVRPSRIRSFEREQVARWAKELAAVPVTVDLDGDHLVVYAADTNPDESIRAMSMLLGTPLGNEAKHREWIVRNSRYSPMFRFTLGNEDERLYSVERWCYLGSIDRWVFLTRNMPLETAANSYLPHVGQESFFELM